MDKILYKNAKKGMDRTSFEFTFELKSEKKVIGGTSFVCMADGEIKDVCITGLLKEEWINE